MTPRRDLGENACVGVCVVYVETLKLLQSEVARLGIKLQKFSYCSSQLRYYTLSKLITVKSRTSLPMKYGFTEDIASCLAPDRINSDSFHFSLVKFP